jgi:small nuclear ribonucleoprotein (snRNP)-like protein
VNEEVIIRLKWGQTEYKGRLVSIDSYMNIQLSGAEEWIDQKMTSALGQVLIRYAMIKSPRLGGGERKEDKGWKLMYLCVAAAITFFGFRARTRTTEMVTQEWKDETSPLIEK